MTAALRMMRAKPERSASASYKTRAVMPTLVAASIAPRKACSKGPSLSQSVIASALAAAEEWDTRPRLDRGPRRARCSVELYARSTLR
jgi:hypothetical protein